MPGIRTDRGRPRFILPTFLKLAIAALPAPRATPLIGSSLIARLIDAFRRGAGRAARGRAGAGRGKPALIGRGLFVADRMLEGDKGARDLIAAAGDDLLEIEVNDISIAIDVDTRASLRLLQRSGQTRLLTNTAKSKVKQS